MQLTVNVQLKFLLMTEFEPRTSGIGSNHSTNWATTTAAVISFKEAIRLQKRFDKTTFRYLLRQKLLYEARFVH